MSTLITAFMTTFGWVAGVGLAMTVVVAALLLVGRVFKVRGVDTHRGTKPDRGSRASSEGKIGRWTH